MARNDEFIARPYPDRLNTEELAKTRALVSGDGKVARLALASRIALAIQSATDPAAVMASAPTATAGTNNANSTVVTDIDVYTPQYLPTSARFTPIGTILADFGSGNYGANHIAEANANSSNGWGLAMSTDAEAIDICLRDVANTRFRIRVREPGKAWAWAQSADYTVTGSGSNFKYYKIDFGSSTDRDLEIYFSATAQVRGINFGYSAGTTAGNNKYRPWLSARRPLRSMIIGDSYTWGTGATNVREGWACVMADRLGIPDAVISGVGGQGFLELSNNSGIPVTSRMADFSRFGPLDLIIIALGMNDYSKVAADLTAAVTTFLTNLLAAQTAAHVVVLGPWTAPGKIATTATENAIKAGFDAVAAVGTNASRMSWVPTVSASWQSTSGGNSTLYIGADTIHANTRGHTYLGNRAANAVGAALGALTA